jgi:crotonobetainyl-CoA:carnitine CoA-transferase CaiB-like acyl-CoA transferase
VPYEVFAASDGDFVLAVGNDALWKIFCEVAGLAPDDRFATNRQRVRGYDEIRPIVARALAAHPRAYWIERLTAAGVPCGSVRDLGDVFGDAQLAARDMIVSMEHAAAGLVRLLGVPVKLSETAGGVRTPPPTLGQHTDAVLGGDLGLSADAIAKLRQQNVI